MPKRQAGLTVQGLEEERHDTSEEYEAQRRAGESELQIAATKLFGQVSRQSTEDIDEIPKLSVEILHACLEPTADQNSVDSFTNQFDKWMLYLCEGFSLLMFGSGSKLKLLERFRDVKLLDFDHFVLRGYRPDASVKPLLYSIAAQYRIKLEPHSSPEDMTEQICRQLRAKKTKDFFLLVHNIDGVHIRDDVSQTCLSMLANLPKCHLVATVDHINAGLLWDRRKLDRFCWLWLPANTKIDHTRELSDGLDSRMLGLTKSSTSGGHSLASIQSIIKAVSAKAKKIFNLLVKTHLERTMELSFWPFYELCKGEFLTNNETGFRQLLVEFKDHRLIETKSSVDGSELLAVIVDDELLHQYMNEEGIEVKKPKKGRTQAIAAGESEDDTQSDSSDD